MTRIWKILLDVYTHTCACTYTKISQVPKVVEESSQIPRILQV